MTIFISIVSHQQGEMVTRLLEDFARLAPDIPIHVTINIPEPSIPCKSPLSLTFHHNERPLGFGANHNQALRESKADFFCILNPDIRLINDPFPTLLKCLSDPEVAIAAPQIIDSQGRQQDSARQFPSLPGLLKKVLGLHDGRIPLDDRDIVSAPWVAGMFLLIRASAFRAVGGFDDKFFLYYEDVDLCARLRKSGWKIRICPPVKVIHDAQRSSHGNLRYARWHLSSMVRYFLKHPISPDPAHSG